MRRHAYVAAFDVGQDARRRRVVKALAAHGVRVQYSVFELELLPAELGALLEGIEELLDGEADRFSLYPRCGICRGGRLLLGRPLGDMDPAAWIVEGDET